MRRYEGVVITDPDLPEEQREQVFSRVLDLIPQAGGFLVERDDWGVRKLAYAIRKKPRGYYVRLDFCGNGAMVDEMERFYRIDDRVLKYMTVLLEKDVDVERLKEEVAAAEQKRAEALADAESKAQEQAAKEAGEAEAAPGETSETEPAEEEQ
jgi:small subunit ribosomal protein S6